MTEDELRAYLTLTRAEVTAQLARLDAMDWSALPTDLCDQVGALRVQYERLLATLARWQT